MHWLTEAQEHEVRDVDDAVDGANPSAFQASGEPIRARTDADASDDDTQVARAALDVFDRDADVAGFAVPRVGRDSNASAHWLCLSGCSAVELQRLVERRRHLSRDAQVREEIRAVRAHVDDNARIGDR